MVQNQEQTKQATVDLNQPIVQEVHCYWQFYIFGRPVCTDYLSRKDRTQKCRIFFHLQNTMAFLSLHYSKSKLCTIDEKLTFRTGGQC